MGVELPARGGPDVGEGEAYEVALSDESHSAEPQVAVLQSSFLIGAFQLVNGSYKHVGCPPAKAN